MRLAAMIWLALAADQEATISLKTDPAGATVTVKGLKGVWTTPCEIPVAGLKGSPVEMMIARKGFETILRRQPVGVKDRVTIAFTLTARAEARVEKPPEPKPPKVAEAVPPRPLRVRVTAPGGAVRVLTDGKVVAEGPVRAGEMLELSVPPGRLRVEHLNEPGGSATHTVEILGEEKPAADRRPRERVGQVQLVHRVYGVFLRLDPGLSLVPGEEIAIVREGREVARSRILQVVGGDETYPDGAAQLARSGRIIRKGDEVRRLR